MGTGMRKLEECLRDCLPG